MGTTGEKKKRTPKKNVDGRSTSSHDNKKFRNRSMEKQRGMAFGFQKTKTRWIDRQCNTHIANNSMHCSEGVFGDSIKEFLPPYSYLNLCYLYLCSMLKDKMYSNNSCNKDIIKQDKQCRYNITLRCIHATLVAVEKQ